MRPLLVALINDGRLSAKERERYFRALDFNTGQETTRLLASHLAEWTRAAFATDSSAERRAGGTAIALEALGRLKGIDLAAYPEVKASLDRWLEHTRGTPQFVELVGGFGLKDQDAALLEIAAKDPAGSLGVEAVRMVLNNQDTDLLKRSLTGADASHIAEALGRAGKKEIVPLLEPVVTDTVRDVALRREAVRALARVQEGAAALLKLAQESRLPADLTFTASAALNDVRWESLKAQAAQVLPVPQAQTGKPLPPISELVSKKGDPIKGAAVFRRDVLACIKCHQVNGEGVDFGPNLSDIGTKLGKDALYQAILDPSAGISFGFEAWRIDLKDGNEAYGLIVSDTADELALKSVGGIVTRYKKSDITTRTQQKLSVMPAGLEQAISQEDLIALVEYLSTLKNPSPQPSATKAGP
ncbi:MAG: hypothetical protein DME25_06125 [Verrucomicrobia bacterium]|nr:MAG: hypothetical protein DME25_06125 [Verrucomicrobiota bacterium]